MGYGRTLSAVSALVALAIAGPAYPSARITGLTDVNFGIINSALDQSSSQNVCIYSVKGNGNQEIGYSVQATGDGAGGAFSLASGSQILPYEVRWADAANQTSGTQLTAGALVTGFANSSDSQTCVGGSQQNASLTVTVRGTQIAAATAGNYSGVLQVTIVPE